MQSEEDIVFFSIIVPVYNVEQYLHRCVDSILNQKFYNFELILVNDGSIDKSGLICDEFEKLDNRVRVFHRQNQGVSIARNIGISNSHGKYILFVDADDFLKQNALEIIADKIAICDSEMILWGFSYFDGKTCYSDCVPKTKEIKINDLECFPEWFNSPVIKAYRRTFLLKNQILFPEHISLAEDMYFSYLCFSKVKSIFCINESLYCYYSRRKGSACNTINMRKIEDEIRSIKILENDLEMESPVFSTSIMERKISAKTKLLSILKFSNIKLFRDSFPEVNNLIWNRKKTLLYFCIFYKLDLLAFVLLITKKLFSRGKNKIKKLFLWSFS